MDAKGGVTQLLKLLRDTLFLPCFHRCCRYPALLWMTLYLLRCWVQAEELQALGHGDLVW